MRYFYDLEFLEDGKIIDPISIGIVAENGDELYLINDEADWERISAHPWLRANVLPHLPGAWGEEMDDQWRPDSADPRVMRRKVLADRVRQFIASFSEDRADHELWAYYGAYDHVALCQLWGRMIDLPGCVPMWTHDLMQALDTRDYRGVDLAAMVPQQSEHHALADARWNRDVYNWRFGS